MLTQRIIALEAQLQALNDNEKESVKEVDILNELAWETVFDDPARAKAFSEDALTTSQHLNYTTGIAHATRNLAYWYLWLGSDLQQAALLARQAINLFEAMQDIKLTQSLGTAWDILALSCIFLDSFDLALKYTIKSMTLFEKADYQRGVAWGYHNLGLIYDKNKDYEKAEKNYHQSLTIFRSMRYPMGISRVCNRLGNLYRKCERYDEALTYQQEGLKIEGEQGRYDLAYAESLLDIGITCREMGALAEAEENFTKSEQILGKRSANKGLYTRLLLEWGLVKKEQKLYQQAIDYLHQALPLTQENETKTLEYRVEAELSDCYSCVKDFEKALTYYKGYEQAREAALISDRDLKLKNLQLIQEIALAEKEAESQRDLKEQTEKLLLKILPPPIAQELQQTGKVKPRYFTSATVLFTDFVNFTQTVQTMPPADLVAELDFCFSEFDKIIAKYSLEKLKTIGDAYMAAAGIPIPIQSHALRCVLAALEICCFIINLIEDRRAQGADFWEVRIGINTGPLIAGIVGQDKIAYDVWGQTVNLASHVETAGQRGKVNITQTTYEEIKQFFVCTHRGKIQIKGDLEMDMYFVECLHPKYAQDTAGYIPNDTLIARL